VDLGDSGYWQILNCLCVKNILAKKVIYFGLMLASG